MVIHSVVAPKKTLDTFDNMGKIKTKTVKVKAEQISVAKFKEETKLVAKNLEDGVVVSDFEVV